MEFVDLTGSDEEEVRVGGKRGRDSSSSLNGSVFKSAKTVAESEDFELAKLLQEAEDKANADIFQQEQVNRDRIQVSSYARAETTPVAIHRRRDGGKCNNVTETKDMFKMERIYWAPIYLVHNRPLNFRSNFNAVSLADVFYSGDFKENPLKEMMFLGMLTDPETLKDYGYLPGYLFDGSVSVLWLDHLTDGDDGNRSSWNNWYMGKVKRTDRYGTHHTKMWILIFEKGVRICIQTGNLVKSNLDYMADGLYVQDFPLKTTEIKKTGTAAAFERDLRGYLYTYLHSNDRGPPQTNGCVIVQETNGVSAPALTKRFREILDQLSQYDFTDAQAEIVYSTPGRHPAAGGSSPQGHLGLSQKLKQGPSARSARQGQVWRPRHYQKMRDTDGMEARQQVNRIEELGKPVTHENVHLVMQISSISSMHKTGRYLRELVMSMSGRHAEMCYRGRVDDNIDMARVHIMWPSISMIDNGIGGREIGGNLPASAKNLMEYDPKTRFKGPWLDYFKETAHQYDGSVSGRALVPPHHKSYEQIRELDGPRENSRYDQRESVGFVPSTQLLWYCMASHNLSQAAWGVTEKKDEKNGNPNMKLYIKSQELGVLFRPHCFPIFLQALKDLDTGVVSKHLVRRFSNTPTHHLLGLPPPEIVRGPVEHVYHSEDGTRSFIGSNSSSSSSRSSSGGGQSIRPVAVAFFASQRASLVDDQSVEERQGMKKEKESPVYVQVHFPVPYAMPSRENRYNENEKGRNATHDPWCITGGW